jgi:polyisoprenoid-binding protein YceI
MTVFNDQGRVSGRNRSRVEVFALALTVIGGAAFFVGSADAAVKLGQRCTKVGLKSGSLSCASKSGRLVWVTTPKATTKPKTKPKTNTKLGAPATNPKANAGALPVVTAKRTPTTVAVTRGPALPGSVAPTVPPVNASPAASPTVTTLPAATPSPAPPAPVAVSPTVTVATTAPVSTNPPTAGVSPIEGAWKVNAGEVGYRVKQTVSGQSVEAVGRTKNVTGSMIMEATTLKSVDMVVATTTFKSEPADTKRDSGVQAVLETAQFPTATISLAGPVDLGQIPADKVEVSKTATFKLTLHGVAKNIAIPIKARRNGATIEIVGSTPIVFGDFGIADPSRRPLLISEDRGVVEFVVSLAR